MATCRYAHILLFSKIANGRPVLSTPGERFAAAEILPVTAETALSLQALAEGLGRFLCQFVGSLVPQNDSIRACGKRK
jgi:hypothetical protein